MLGQERLPGRLRGVEIVALKGRRPAACRRRAGRCLHGVRAEAVRVDHRRGRRGLLRLDAERPVAPDAGEHGDAGHRAVLLATVGQRGQVHAVDVDAPLAELRSGLLAGQVPDVGGDDGGAQPHRPSRHGHDRALPADPRALPDRQLRRVAGRPGPGRGRSGHVGGTGLGGVGAARRQQHHAEEQPCPSHVRPTQRRPARFRLRCRADGHAHPTGSTSIGQRSTPPGRTR